MATTFVAYYSRASNQGTPLKTPVHALFPPLAALFLAGCAAAGPGPGGHALPLETPAAWQGPSAAGRVGGWLTEFRDPALSGAVDEAVAGNFDLRAAASRMRAARAQARIVGAERLPRVQLAARASRSDPAGAGVSGVDGGAGSRFELQGQVSWEADLWGRLSDSTRAARADSQAAEADYRAARLSLAASIARRWFDVIEARAQTRLARDTVDSFRNTLEAIENRYRQGLGDALDVRLARNNLAGAEANLSRRQREERSLARSLETLLGRYPEGALELPESLPRIDGPVPAGMPDALLARRPDLVAGAARLRAAGYRLSASEKNRLPGLTLTAEGGAASDALRDVVALDDLVWSLVAGLVQPLFQGGRLDAERALARAREDEALNAYAQAVLTAFREVEDALDAEGYLAAQQSATREAADEANAAEALALDQYRRGLGDIIALLVSQRRRFDAESALIAVGNQRLQNRINLHLALGGDFARDAGQGLSE